MKFIFVFFFLSITPAFACTPAPVEWRNDLKNLLISQLMTKHWASLESLKSASVTEMAVLRYDWVKSDPGYQCHDKEEVSAKVAVSFIHRDGKSLCKASAKIIVTNSLYEGAPRAVFKMEEETSSCSSS